MIMRIIWFILAVAAGLAMMIYRERIARTVGKSDLAEKYLGAGGTYAMWSIIGIITIFVGLLILMGKMTFLGV